MTGAERAEPMFELGYHAQITRTAAEGALSAAQLEFVVVSNLSVDLDQFNSCLHFDNCAFACGLEQIERLWALIDGRSDRFDTVSLAAFGRLLHTTQDFYAHSNWIELHVALDPLPIWNQRLDDLPAELVSGTFFLDTPKMCGSGAPSHSELNKDGPDTPEGRKVVGDGPHQGNTLFELAVSTAVAASRVQFARLVGDRPTPGVTTDRVGPDAGAMEQLVRAVANRVDLLGDRPDG